MSVFTEILNAGPVPWRFVPSLKAAAQQRLDVLRQMTSAEEISNSVLIDLTSTSGATRQLDYLAGVVRSVDGLVHGDHRLGCADLVDVLLLLATAIDEISEFVSVEHTILHPGLQNVRNSMTWLAETADRLEHGLLESEKIDNATAGKLARVYLVTVVKGGCCEANRARFTWGIGSSTHRAFVGNVVERLADLIWRFGVIGDGNGAGTARELLRRARHHFGPYLAHGKTREAIVSFLHAKIRFMYDPLTTSADIVDSERRKRFLESFPEREAAFTTCLDYFTRGNRRLSPAILDSCGKVFCEIGDDMRAQRLGKLAREEQSLNHTFKRTLQPRSV